MTEDRINKPFGHLKKKPICPLTYFKQWKTVIQIVTVFAFRCSCKFETRSLTIIKVVVILVIWVISILVIYMGFLSCLDPILNKRAGLRSTGASVNYREHHDERLSDDEGSGSERAQGADGGATPMRTYGGAEAVINRLGNQQTKWKKQVQEQRRNIYDRHAMLN